jgi:hypothetical protein
MIQDNDMMGIRILTLDEIFCIIWAPIISFIVARKWLGA